MFKDAVFVVLLADHSKGFHLRLVIFLAPSWGYTAQEMKFFIKDFFIIVTKFPVGLVTFAEEILNRKLFFV